MVVESRSEQENRIRVQRRRILLSGAVGTTIEYFDFLLFGLIAPVVFNELFYPKSNAMVATIAVLGTFAAGYVARPLGGLVFGHFGDRIGRKPVMFTTLVLMGASTTAIGLLPTYATVGVIAPILLVLLRCLQGIALGGETVGAVILATESAPSGKRGGYAGVIQIGAAAGSVLAALGTSLVASMPADDRLSWGWRVPFLLSAVLVIVGVYVRAKVEESQVFQRAATDAPRRVPLISALRQEPRACITIFLTVITETSMLQIFTVYVLVYGAQELHIPNSLMLTGIMIGNVFGLITNPLFGRLSDFIGRRAVIAGSLIASALYVVLVFFQLLATGNPVLIVLAIAIPPAIIQTSIFGAEGSFFAELFRSATRRFSGLGVSRQLGGVIGGMFPMIAAALFATTGTIWSVVGYYAAITVISLTAVLLARETNRETLT
ncbi:MFS transporter [Saccharopolyspora sp. NPDC049357]|uniref:MFS transporter n=1 Tax=Saccharopolyspora sp. NPDC049357 TaxID=3154507 RepID=UPI0034392835